MSAVISPGDTVRAPITAAPSTVVHVKRGQLLVQDDDGARWILGIDRVLRGRWRHEPATISAPPQRTEPNAFAQALVDAPDARRRQLAQRLDISIGRLKRHAREGWMPEPMLRRQIGIALGRDHRELFPENARHSVGPKAAGPTIPIRQTLNTGGPSGGPSGGAKGARA